MNERPLILLTNDDGIFSPGLWAVCEAVLPLGEVLVVAPRTQQTSMGRSYPRTPEAGIITPIKGPLVDARVKSYAVEGSPAHCVLHAVLELTPQKPKLCISGINYGENLGKTLTYSGTLGAALQAADFGIPALAISCPVAHELMRKDTYAKLDWTMAKAVVARWAGQVLAEGMPYGAPVLNINLPERCDSPEDFCFTFQSNSDPFFYNPPQKRDFAQPYLLPSGKKTDFSEETPGSDIYAVCVENRVSVTPVCGNYTHLSYWNTLQK